MSFPRSIDVLLCEGSVRVARRCEASSVCTSSVLLSPLQVGTVASWRCVVDAILGVSNPLGSTLIVPRGQTLSIIDFVNSLHRNCCLLCCQLVMLALPVLEEYANQGAMHWS